MKRYLRLVGILVVVAGLTAGGYLHFVAQPASAATTNNLNTAQVQRGNLAATVSGAGNITPAQAVALNFQQTGVVQKINVQSGDQIKAGQVLAQLDAAALQLQLQNAQLNLKNAQDNLAKAKNPNTAQDIASARAALSAAQANYNKVVAGPTAADMAAAQSAVVSAQAAYDAAVKSAGTTNATLTAAAAGVQKAQATLQQAQAAYDKVAGSPNISMLSQSVTLQQATIDYQSAQANYQAVQATSQTDANSKVQSAKTGLTQAQANLTKLRTQVTQDDITSAQAQVTQAQDNLEKLLAGSDANTLDIAQNGVDQAQIAIQQAQLALQNAEILAPFDGTVTAVNITVGQNATSSSAGAIQIADLNHLQIVVNMAEVDVSRIKAGQDVQVDLDALPNATLQGKVGLVAPAGVLTQGVVNYPVTIDLTNPPSPVKSGMTANVSIIIAQRTSVLMVPNRAVRTAPAGTASSAVQGANGNTGANGGQSARPNSQGAAGSNGTSGGTQGARPNSTGNGGSQRPVRQQYVTVLQNGQQVQVPVQTGLSSDTLTEIVSGLNEGDVVVLNTTTAAAPRAGGGPGVGFPGVGRIGG
jgi:HlyD family secretion protein